MGCFMCQVLEANRAQRHCEVHSAPQTSLPRDPVPSLSVFSKGATRPKKPSTRFLSWPRMYCVAQDTASSRDRCYPCVAVATVHPGIGFDHQPMLSVLYLIYRFPWCVTIDCAVPHELSHWCDSLFSQPPNIFQHGAVWPILELRPAVPVQ